MNGKQLRNSIYEAGFCDLKVLEITSRFFGDELFLSLGDVGTEPYVHLSFLSCYHISMDYVWSYKKPELRNLSSGQPCFFAQSIEISDIENKGGEFFQFDLDLFPLTVKVTCRKFIETDAKGNILVSASKQSDVKSVHTGDTSAENV
ncbi:MAG: hypothetical protein Q8865_09400 [Bacillota bacterium]|nr:hypothetical protein [Bacillota bacterium]